MNAVNYELANELKEAGFIQTNAGSRVAPPDKVVVRREDFAYVPTLEELIEACGKDYFSLSGNPGEWIASFGAATRSQTNWIEGSTPTEAVARLWLALNKK
jgi:hypothetical protein